MLGVNPTVRRLWPSGKPKLAQVFWQNLWPHGQPMLEQSFHEGLHPMERTGVKDPCWSSLWRTVSCRKDSLLSCLWRTVSNGWDPTQEHWKSMRRKERQMWWTDHNPHSPSPCSVSEAEPRKKGRWFKICFYFSLPTLTFDWQYIKLISPSWVCFACDSDCWVISLSLSQPMSISSYFLSPVQQKRGSDKDAWWAPSF